MCTNQETKAIGPTGTFEVLVADRRVLHFQRYSAVLQPELFLLSLASSRASVDERLRQPHPSSRLIDNLRRTMEYLRPCISSSSSPRMIAAFSYRSAILLLRSLLFSALSRVRASEHYWLYPRRRLLHLSLCRLKGKLLTAGSPPSGTLAIPGCGERNYSQPCLRYGPPRAGCLETHSTAKRYSSFRCQHELSAVVFSHRYARSPICPVD